MKRFGGILFCLILCYCCYGQGEEVKVESSTEVMDSTKFSRLTKTYNRVIMAEKKELSLIKLDLLGPLLFALNDEDSSIHNVIRATFEQKFKPEWSWLIAGEAEANEIEFTEVRARGAVRYYYNMNKRILKGKSANNFSANYLSGRLTYANRPGEDDHKVSLDLLFGIQRRLWKYGFLDFDIGLENIIDPFRDNDWGVDLTASFQLGVAF